MSNLSLRERFRLAENKAALVSQVIGATKDATLIKDDESATKSTRHALYLPFWAWSRYRHTRPRHHRSQTNSSAHFVRPAFASCSPCRFVDVGERPGCNSGQRSNKHMR